MDVGSSFSNALNQIYSAEKKLSQLDDLQDNKIKKEGLVNLYSTVSSIFTQMQAQEEGLKDFADDKFKSELAFRVHVTAKAANFLMLKIKWKMNAIMNDSKGNYKILEQLIRNKNITDLELYSFLTDPIIQVKPSGGWFKESWLTSNALCRYMQEVRGVNVKEFYDKQKFALHAPLPSSVSSTNPPPISTANSAPPRPSTALPPDILIDTHAAEMITLQSALKQNNKKVLVLEGKSFTVLYDSHISSIRIFDDHDQINIRVRDDGIIQSVMINGKSQDLSSVSVEQQKKIQACFDWALEATSTYKSQTSSMLHNYGEIHIIRRGLSEIPEYHLNQLTNLLKAGMNFSYDPKFTVVFYRDDLTTSRSEGKDQGGLARDYLDDLMVSIKQNLSIQSTTGEDLPKTRNQSRLQDPLPVLESEEMDIYQNIGKLMMYAFNSKQSKWLWDTTCSLGRQFNDVLFKAVLSLTADEINTPFDQLSLDTQLKLFKALAVPEINLDYNIYADRIKYLIQLAPLSSLDGLTDQELKKIATQVLYAEVLPQEFVDDDLDMPIVAAIRKDPEKFKKALFDSIFNVKLEGGLCIAELLAPIHAIAQGMKSFCQPPVNEVWDKKIMKNDPNAFSAKVQGSVDRQEIVNHIAFSLMPVNSIAQKKTEWLKEWLLHDASDEDVRNFLKYATGSSSLPKEKNITVYQQFTDIIPFPKASTCALAVYISGEPKSSYMDYDDATKENFIRGLKEVVLKNPSAYQTG